MKRGKSYYSDKNLSVQSREPTNSTHIWRRPRPHWPHWWEVSAVTITPSLLSDWWLLRKTPLDELIEVFSVTGVADFRLADSEIICAFRGRWAIISECFRTYWNGNWNTTGVDYMFNWTAVWRVRDISRIVLRGSSWTNKGLVSNSVHLESWIMTSELFALAGNIFRRHWLT